MKYKAKLIGFNKIVLNMRKENSKILKFFTKINKTCESVLYQVDQQKDANTLHERWKSKEIGQHRLIKYNSTPNIRLSKYLEAQHDTDSVNSTN